MINKIPLVFFQTNKTYPNEYVINMIKKQLTPNWKYEFFNDNDIINFFIANPLPDFQDIILKFNSFEKGAHKADLFRYYYLYINGGVFMDSDAMIYEPIENIIKDYDFFSVLSTHHKNLNIFQGCLGSTPNNVIIKKALIHAYNTTNDVLKNDYHCFCDELYNIVSLNKTNYNIKLYKEIINPYYADILNDKNQIIFKHYWKNKYIKPHCILLCVFNNINYVKLLFLLLESIYIYGNINDETDILIYTSTNFMNIIKNSHLFSNSIKFEINDTYDTIDKACKSRLDFFNLQSACNYNKILYLDTDILVKNDINKVFDVCKEDLLYVLEEGTIDDVTDYWGKTLFSNEINNYNDKSAFTSGILLFNNCEKIKELFENIQQHIIETPKLCTFNDQPYIVYNAFKYNLYNNKILKSIVVNNDNNIHSDKVIHHFPGGPGVYEHKIDSMNIFLNKIKDYTISTNIDKTKKYITNNLLPIINNIGELLEGNIFTLHHTIEYTDTFINKTKNISNIVLNNNIQNVMEIGFNAGFSSLLMLLSNSKLKITCYDLGEHKYTHPCYEKIKETFGDRINIVYGDSTKTLQNVNNNYDLIHIDGGHSTEVAESDIICSYKLSKINSILIMDDYDFPNLKQLWDTYIKLYNLNPLHIKLYETPHHSIKYISNKSF